jgi:hypothetical protein
MKHTRACAVLLTYGLLLIVCGSALGASWPQTGRTPQHTDYTPDSPTPPYVAVWNVDFSPECVYSAQPIVAGDLLYATTLQGHLYALDAASGERRWYVKAGEAMWGGAAAGTPEHGGAGQVFVASWDGTVCGLEATTGRVLWRFPTGEPISSSPCLAQGAVFIGTRRGTMLAIATNGTLRWRQPLSWHIYSTAAFNDSKVFVVTEDMFVHCLDAATGREIWTSEKLNGICHREYYPVVHGGKVFVAVTPAVYHRAGPGMGVEPFGWQRTPAELLEKCRQANLQGQMPPEMEEIQQRIIRYYKENPDYQTFYVLNESDGRQAFLPVHQYSGGGLENLVTPPPVCADGQLMMHCDGFGGRDRLLRYDPRINRWSDMMLWSRTEPNDNGEYVAVGGSRVFSKGFFGGDVVLDLESRTVHKLGAGRRRIPTTKISCMTNVWEVCAPFSRRRLGKSPEHVMGIMGASPPVIAGKMFFFMNRDQILTAYEGK